MTHFKIALLGSAMVVLVSIPALSQTPDYAPPRARTYAGDVLRPLTGPSDGSPAAIVAEYLRQQGLDIAESSIVTGGGPVAAAGGVRTVRLEQVAAGLQVFAAYAKASFSAEGALVYLIENFAVGSPDSLPAPAISAAQGLGAVLQHLYPGQVIAVGVGRANGNSVVFDRTAFFHASPRVTRVAYQAPDGALRIGMLVETWSDRNNELYHTLVGGAAKSCTSKRVPALTVTTSSRSVRGSTGRRS